MVAAASRILKLLLFYTIFYCVLAAFAGAMYKIFSMTLDDHEPKWQQESSLIGGTPGLTVRPNVFFSTLNYNPRKREFAKQWKYLMDDFLDPYAWTTHYINGQKCEDGNPGPGSVCKFETDFNTLGECSSSFDYGLANSSAGPCIFLKLNKIYGWKPEFYHHSEYLPETMPRGLVEDIEKEESGGKKNLVWVDCRGVRSIDSDNLGPVHYYPERGFNGKYFPYTNVVGYQSPLVAVRFLQPERGVVINVECKVWAANIRHDIRNSKGGIRLSFVVD